MCWAKKWRRVSARVSSSVCMLAPSSSSRTWPLWRRRRREEEEEEDEEGNKEEEEEEETLWIASRMEVRP